MKSSRLASRTDGQPRQEEFPDFGRDDLTTAPRSVERRIRYIGSKSRVAGEILEVLAKYRDESARFVDLFSGTGTVSRCALLEGWRILANDFLHSSATITYARLLSRSQVPFTRFGGYERAIEKLNELNGVVGPIFREYSPSGLSSSGHDRMYFTVENGQRIDAMRSQICAWRDSSQITHSENCLLLADLLSASSRVANTAGTYGCFLRDWQDNALRDIRLVPDKLLDFSQESVVLCQDAFSVDVNLDDLVYVDPPYTKRQYAAYYHLAETICIGDSPKVGGVTGLRPWREKSSPFCYKRRVLGAFESLVRGLTAKRVAISYSCDGHASLSDLKGVLKDFGRVDVFDLGSVERYAPNDAARENSTHVTEYLIVLIRD